jgi:hypothetical protein
MLAGKKNIINIIKNIKNLNEKKNKRRDLKGSKNLWLNENIVAPIWTAIFAAEDAAKIDTVSTRQPCYLISMLQDLGQWLCVPPFQAVCLLRVLRLYGKNNEFYMQRLCKIIPFFTKDRYFLK